MFKCPFCPNEIDEQKEIHPGNVHDQQVHSAALSTWRQILVTSNGVVLANVHACSDHDLKTIGLVLPKVKA